MPLRPSPVVGAALDAAADQHGLSRDLLRAVAYVESRYDPAAESPVGAIGLLQLMPDTAVSLGVDPYDPQQNAEGGARFLASLLQQFDGDLVQALAAYNWGPGNVRSGKPWPRSVTKYVHDVIARYRPGEIAPTPENLWRVFIGHVLKPLHARAA